MDSYSFNRIQSQRDKLGLCLAGGGFRASLFHLGVLWRMAELDLLRYVEVLSTVSGGSIIGALYVLLLKDRLQQKATLEQEDYIDIVNTVDEILLKGIKKNLRLRLFMNPLGILRVLTTSDSLGRRMGRIYERYLYSRVKGKQSRWKRLWRPRSILLRDNVMTPGGDIIKGGIELYNDKAVKNNSSAVTKIVINATSLNSGTPFYFSAIEIGDLRLGFFRYDEINLLLARKHFLDNIVPSDIETYIKKVEPVKINIRGNEVELFGKTLSLILWWKSGRSTSGPQVPEEWKPVFIDNLPNALMNIEFGQLRKMKLSAWYIRQGTNSNPPVTGGFTVDEHLEQLWDALDAIDSDLLTIARQEAVREDFKNLFLDFIIEIYYLRSAEIMSKKIYKDWDKLTIGDAVGASACFPPVFPPYTVMGIYEDWHVSTLGLTDGGVYDNVGLTALINEGCNYIIASDTSGLFDVIKRSSTGRIGMGGRIVSILMDDVASYQRELVRKLRKMSKLAEECTAQDKAIDELRISCNLKGLSYFHIKSKKLEIPDGLNLNLDSNLLASLRTDLDGFGEIEIAALVNHGYDISDRYLRKYLEKSPYKRNKYWHAPSREPKPILRSNKVSRILEVGHSRFFRSLQLFAPVSVLFTVILLILVVYNTWQIKTSIHDSVNTLVQATLNWLDVSLSQSFPLLQEGWVKKNFSVGAALLILICFFIILKLLPLIFLNWLKNRYLKLFSRIATILKWVKGLSTNVLWLFGFFPLLISFIVSGVSWINYVFYYLPFKVITRNSK